MPMRACIGHVQGDAIGVVLEDRQQRGHVLGRVVRLQVGGLTADHAVIGGVALVEAVARELLPVGEDRVGGFFAMPFCDAPFDEFRAVFVDLLAFLLGDGLAQVVRLRRACSPPARPPRASVCSW